jgi:hypothetical protein
MSMTEDFEISRKAYQFLMGQMGEWKKGVEKDVRGVNHTVNKQACEIEDLWKAIEDIRVKHEALINRLKKKFAGDQS